MPIYFDSEFLWAVLGCLLAFAAVTSLLLTFAFRTIFTDVFVSEVLAILFCMALLGVVTGYLTGLSRSPAMGAVLPAVLTLIGGLVLFIISGEKAPGRRMLTAAATAALMTNLLIGTLWGTLSRADPATQSGTLINDEILRESICYKRLAYEIASRKERIQQRLPDVNPNLLVPGCTPPFDPKTYEVADPDAASQ